MSSDIKDMAKNLARRTKEMLGLNQKQLAKLTGTSEGYISSLLNDPSEAFAKATRLWETTGRLRNDEDFEAYLRSLADMNK